MNSATRRFTAILLSGCVALIPAAAADGAAAKKRKPPARGQCGDWAVYKRPELKTFYGGAGGWDDIARRRGFPVDTTPRAGDIAVFEANEYGAGPIGHVAYVERVSRNGKLSLSEFNWNTNETYYSRSNVSPEGLSFIHKKPKKKARG